MAQISPRAVDWESGVTNAWNSVATFVPKAIAFLVILVVGWLVAKALAKIVDKVLERVGFDRAVERGGVKQALAKSKYDASDIVAKLVYYFVFLTALVMAFNVFGPNPISTLLAGVIAFLPKLAVAILIVVVAAAIAKAVKDLVGGALGGLSYGNTLATIASVFILGIGIVAALNQIGVATAVTTPILVTVLATIGGILVVGVGGGLIKPMQQRWERWLDTAERETATVRAEVARASAGGRHSASPTNLPPVVPTGLREDLGQAPPAYGDPGADLRDPSDARPDAYGDRPDEGYRSGL